MFRVFFISLGNLFLIKLNAYELSKLFISYFLLFINSFLLDLELLLIFIS